MRQDEKPAAQRLLFVTDGECAVTLTLPTGEEVISTDSVDPFLGATVMEIHGRFGWNLAATVHSIGDDAPIQRSPMDVDGTLVHAAGSLAWRVDPVEYGSDFVAASYLVLDSNAYFGGSDNTEWWLAPGFLYEAPDFALELSLILFVHLHCIS